MVASAKDIKPIIVPAQLRAARALLDWSQERLSEACGARPLTLYRLEHGLTQPHHRTAQAIRQALEIAGVEFIEAADGKGPGVRLARPPEL